MLDADLAVLYGVSTKALNQAVARNRRRFPGDFMFRLTLLEVLASRSQIVTLKSGRGSNVKYLPYAFTEQGVAMLSSVLRSEEAVDVNIEIMRTFVRLRHLIQSHADLARKLEDLERKYDGQFATVFEAIRQMMLRLARGSARGAASPRQSLGTRRGPQGRRISATSERGTATAEIRFRR